MGIRIKNKNVDRGSLGISIKNKNVDMGSVGTRVKNKNVTLGGVGIRIKVLYSIFNKAVCPPPLYFSSFFQICGGNFSKNCFWGQK